MAKAKGIWPAWFSEALDEAIAHGSAVARFDTQVECEAMRLRFYKFLKETREGDGPRAKDAENCAVQWMTDGHTKSKRVLRFEIRAPRTVDPLVRGEDVAAIEQRIAVERAIAEARKEIGK